MDLCAIKNSEVIVSQASPPEMPDERGRGEEQRDGGDEEITERLPLLTSLW